MSAQHHVGPEFKDALAERADVEYGQVRASARCARARVSVVAEGGDVSHEGISETRIVMWAVR